jgi:alpha-galactosidase
VNRLLGEAAARAKAYARYITGKGSMKKNETSRREFFKTATAASLLTIPITQSQGQTTSTRYSRRSSDIDVLRRPDRVIARFVSEQIVQLQYAGQEWTYPGIRVSAEPIQKGQRSEVPVTVRSPGGKLTYLHLRWEGHTSESIRSIGDHWERSYGDLEWRTTAPDRVMPWYFLTFDGARVDGFGVKTQPSTFCFWQRDTEGVSLWIDLRNGGEAVSLGDRELQARTIVTRKGSPGESASLAAREFCMRMSPAPRLPKGPIFGSNDWNYAYGSNTPAGILRDADLIASLAPVGKHRPYIVIDDGWQDAKRFPSMSDLAAGIRARNLCPGMWIRPIRAPKTAPQSWLLPRGRFGQASQRSDLAFDPTIPEALNEVLNTVRTSVRWGYEFIKHDFSTYELFGRWGSEMGAQPTLPGWHFHDRSRTNAEIIIDLYRDIRLTAGQEIVILGCNTVGHLAAGLFESQRIADDTSGREWERTRRFGVNGLSHRIAQHRTFSHIDPDIVAITPDVGWRQTSQWLDLVARSGTSLFIAPDPASITPEIRSAMKDAMALASEEAAGVPKHCIEATTPEQWEFHRPTHSERRYNWCGPDGASPFSVS